MKDLKHRIKKFIENEKYQGIEWIIQNKDNVYFDRVGYLDLESKTPFPENTIYRIWSMTKPIISIVILQMIEEKKINLNDPINLYLPIFSNLTVLENNYSSIKDIKKVDTLPTIKNLLLHTAGFSYNFLGDLIGNEYHNLQLFYSENTTLEEEINTLATVPLLYEPDSRWVYSVSIDILARIIEIVSQNSLEFELKQRIFDPLKMENTAFSIKKEDVPKLMTSYHYDETTNKLIPPNVNPRYISNYGYPLHNKKFSRGGIGLYSTTNDYMKFVNMLRKGRSDDNISIISKETLNQAIQNQISLSFLPFEIKNFDVEYLTENLFDPYGWGYGFRTLMKETKFKNKGEFGWSGAASTYFMVDQKNSITAVLMTQVFQGDPNLHKEFYDFIYSNM